MTPEPTLAELIALKRDGARWGDAAIGRIVRALVARAPTARLSDAQAGALAMAVVLRGLDRAETVALTAAMRDSGRVLRWRGLPGPILDKHSTGGVGDTVSLMLGPMLAACGAFVPMISGRSLGHTGGTLDKLESIPGYTVRPGIARLRRVVREAGVAIVAAGAELAPADRRLYAIRDVTATVESIPLIVASILSKKLAAGLQGLVMDVKTGPGAFIADLACARQLARTLTAVGVGAGLPVRAWLTPMDQPLANVAGNALEMRLAVDYLTGRARPARLHAVTMTLCEDALVLGGLAADRPAARRSLQAALDRGTAAERFERMVAGLGGPADLLARAQTILPEAPVQRAVRWAGPPGTLGRIDTRALGWAVVRLGGGRQRGGEAVDPRVGLADLLALGERVETGTRLATVHAADEDAAARAVLEVAQAFSVESPEPGAVGVMECIPSAEDTTDTYEPRPA